MPVLPPYIESHKADAVRIVCILVKVHYAIPQCMTTCDIPVVHDGDTYLPTADLAVDGIRESEEDPAAVSATVRIGNANGYWGALLASLAPADRTPTVQVFQAWLSPSSPSPTPEAVRGLLVGAVESDSWTPVEATLTVGPATDQKAATLPWREIATRCTYRRFKGAQCGYAGAATSCDRSLATCTTLGNQARFGGFVTLPTRDPVEIEMDGVYVNDRLVVTLTLGKES